MKNRVKSTANTISLRGCERILPRGDLPISGVLVMRPEAHVMAYWDTSDWVPLSASGWYGKFSAPMPEIPVGSWAVINRLRLAGGTRYLRMSLNPSAFLLAFRHVDIAETTVPVQLSPEASHQDDEPERTEVSEDVRDYVADYLSSL